MARSSTGGGHLKRCRSPDLLAEHARVAVLTEQVRSVRDEERAARVADEHCAPVRQERSLGHHRLGVAGKTLGFPGRIRELDTSERDRHLARTQLYSGYRILIALKR